MLEAQGLRGGLTLRRRESARSAPSDGSGPRPHSSSRWRLQFAEQWRPTGRSCGAPSDLSFRSYRLERIEPTISYRPYTTLEVPGWAQPAVATRRRDLASHIRALAPRAARVELCQ